MIATCLACAAMEGTSLRVETDLARYQPGRPVHIRVHGTPAKGANIRLRFFHLGEEVGSRPARPWTGVDDEVWQPPHNVHGYLGLAEVESSQGSLIARATCGIDVSSRWTDFPRYGYIAHFGPELAQRADAILARLNRFHIDGLQFYDWQWKHHHPLSPDATWVDIAKRTTSGETVRAFIRAAHKRNVCCMAYNLGFGGVDGFDTDGISPKWELFRDSGGKDPYALNMPAGWATKKIYLFDPASPEWQSAIFPREAAALSAYGFDGWHMDQLGDLGKVFDDNGRPVDLKSGFPALLAGAREAVPGTLIFNNVGGYGIDQTLASPVDAMYLECWQWTGQKTFADLKRTIERMRSTGKAAILAAYMDYESAKRLQDKRPGDFNLTGVLLTDATIFASGGFHLELGDDGKMLDNEYFPNHKLEPNAGLLERLEHYYDFVVAYEELLSGRDVEPVPSPVQVQGRIWTFARKSGGRTIVHLINLAEPEKLEWRDPDGNCRRPEPLEDVRVQVGSGWRSAFVASPDDGMGLPHNLSIRNGEVVIPRVDYWTMLVLA